MHRQESFQHIPTHICAQLDVLQVPRINFMVLRKLLHCIHPSDDDADAAESEYENHLDSYGGRVDPELAKCCQHSESFRHLHSKLSPPMQASLKIAADCSICTLTAADKEAFPWDPRLSSTSSAYQHNFHHTHSSPLFGCHHPPMLRHTNLKAAAQDCLVDMYWGGLQSIHNTSSAASGHHIKAQSSPELGSRRGRFGSHTYANKSLTSLDVPGELHKVLWHAPQQSHHRACNRTAAHGSMQDPIHRLHLFHTMLKTALSSPQVATPPPASIGVNMAILATAACAPRRTWCILMKWILRRTVGLGACPVMGGELGACPECAPS